MNELEYQKMKDILYGEFELQLEKQFAMRDFINNLIIIKKGEQIENVIEMQKLYGTTNHTFMGKLEEYRTCEVLSEEEFYKLPDKGNTFKINNPSE